MECLMFLVILFGVSIDFISAQLSLSETLISKTFCELTNVTIDCGPNNVIALQQIQYGYATRCSTQCCQSKESSDCLVSVTDTTDLKRVCSGQSSCNATVVISHDFCSFGRLAASYVYFEYYCIPKSRIMSVCSSSTITSFGERLYLTNMGYPGATIGTRSCSCSLEAESCSSGTSRFIIDADLYSEPINCLQSLSILYSNNTLLESIQCETYYNGFVKQTSLSSNYIKIKFDSNSTQNLEGYFFVGFKASESGVQFSLTCSSIPATWCIDCGIPNNISNGIVALDTPNKIGFNSTASVTCYPGFNPNTTRIVCKERGIWESASCTPKDCGLPKNITNGIINLDVAAQTIYNSSAKVTCNAGFNATATRIVCTENGTWETVTCVPKDCGLPKNITNGFVNLDVATQTVFNSSATVKCNAGFIANATRIVCTENGTWESATCVTKDCGIPKNITNGSVSLDVATQTVYNSTATVTCNAGFIANATRIVCTENGTWESATCVPKYCGIPTNITNGILTLDVPSQTVYNSTAIVTCNTGFIANAPKIKCTENGTWENASCIPNGTGNCIEGWRKCFHSNGTFTCTDPAVPCDCGPVPSISDGDITLQDPNNTTYGATANVECATGYQASKTTISCQASGMWESTNCTVIVCGPVENIPFGEIRLDIEEVSYYGATASVQCIKGYPTKSPITCLASGKWETANCVQDSVIPVETKEDDNTTTILIVVLVLVIPFVIQLIMTITFHVITRKYTEKDASRGTAAFHIVLCVIPYIGLGFIMKFYVLKVYKKYHVNHHKHQPADNSYDRAYRSSTELSIANKKSSAKNSYSNPQYDALALNGKSTVTTEHDSKSGDKSRTVEDDADETLQNPHDSVTHTDIQLEHHQTHPDDQLGNHRTMTRGNSAVLNSHTDLTDVGKPYQHLHPQRKDSDHYTKLHGGTLHEISHDHGNHILEERRKSRSGHVEFH